MRIAHPAIDELKLPDTPFILLRRVISGIDVLEVVATPLESFPHMDHRSTIEFLDHQRAVLRTEADTVAKGGRYAGFARLVGNVVEIAIRIRLIEVNGRWNLVCMHRAKRRAQAGRATRALRMSDL